MADRLWDWDKDIEGLWPSTAGRVHFQMHQPMIEVFAPIVDKYFNYLINSPRPRCFFRLDDPAWLILADAVEEAGNGDLAREMRDHRARLFVGWDSEICEPFYAIHSGDQDDDYATEFLYGYQLA